jgi:hypothetical protein
LAAQTVWDSMSCNRHPIVLTQSSLSATLRNQRHLGSRRAMMRSAPIRALRDGHFPFVAA